MGMVGFDIVVLLLQSSIGKYSIPIQNMNATISDTTKVVPMFSQGVNVGEIRMAA